MTTNGYHSLPSDSSAPSTRPSASSSASPTNDLRQSLMMDAAAHDVPLDTLTKPPQPPPQHKQLSVEPHFVSRFNHQSSISADIDAIRGTGIFSKLLPGPFWIKNIIVTEACERYAYYSLRAVLTLYLKNVLGLAATTATSLSLYSQALAYFMPLFGGYISDSHWGKYKTIMRFSFVYIVGSLALAGSTLDAWAWLTYIALVLVAIGTGGIKPCVSAFGADQFSGEYARLVPKERLVKEVSRFFGVFYFSINTGSVLSFILSPIFRTEVGYWLAFGMPAVFLCIATFVFWSARNSYLKFPATGSVITPMIRVFREGWKHREEARLQPGRTWLDTAVGHNGVQPADVVNAKGFWRILPFYAVMPAFWMLFDQQSNAWVLQGERMYLHGLQPEQMTLANPVFVLLLIPLLEKYIYPWLAARHIQFDEFRRIGLGILLSVASFLVAAFVQSLIPDDESRTGPSIFLQVPQYFLISLAEIFISITGLEFAYTQSPPALKSLITAVWLITTGAGNLLAGILWDALGNRMTVVALNILFAALMLLDGIAFLHVSANFVSQESQVGNLAAPTDVAADGGSSDGSQAAGVELGGVHGVDAYNAPEIRHEMAHVGGILNE